jgi:hypothetical protein
LRNLFTLMDKAQEEKSVEAIEDFLVELECRHRIRGVPELSVYLRIKSQFENMMEKDDGNSSKP